MNVPITTNETAIDFVINIAAAVFEIIGAARKAITPAITQINGNRYGESLICG